MGRSSVQVSPPAAALVMLAFLPVAGCAGGDSAAREEGMIQRNAPPQAEYRQEEVWLETGVRLEGTLVVPAAAGKVPAVLIVAGSGPTDRDGNSPLLGGRNDSLRLLAEGLAGYGIASLRYDKRGVGGSKAPGVREADLSFDDFVADAAGWIRMLRADPRFSAVAVIGHSEGALVGMIAAGDAGSDAFVSIAGPGRPVQDTLLAQIGARMPSLLEQSSAIVARLREGREVQEVPAELQPLFRPSVQPFLISMFRRDPARELARLHVPVLIVAGGRDLQISVEEARLLAAARPGARLEVIEGMNHVLKEAPADVQGNMATYAEPGLPLAPGLLRTVGSFLSEALGQRRER